MTLIFDNGGGSFTGQVYQFMGSVDTVAELQSLDTTNFEPGYVYNVVENGKNYAWNGTEWDDIGGIFPEVNDATLTITQDGTSIGTFTANSSTNTTINVSAVNKALSNLSAEGNARLHALKGYEDAGELLTDEEGLADVKSYEHTTFDLSKFTKTGSPTVTTDGIVSNFSIYGSSYLTFPTIQLADYDSWEVITPTFRIDDTLSSGSNYLFLLNYNLYFGGIQMFTKNDNKLRVLLGSSSSTDSDILLLNTLVLSEDIDYTVKIQFTGTRYIVSYKAGNGNWTEYGSVDSTTKFYSSLNTFRIGYACGNITMDLKQFSIKGDGVPVFSSNQTGTDTYTINSSTVSIPYTLSKTGSKIVDSAYRTQVSAVYNEFGYAPYYTLSDTDFTLPQGEIYGMIAKASESGGSSVTVDQTYDATSANPQSGTAVAEAIATVDTTEIEADITALENKVYATTPSANIEIVGNLIENQGVLSGFTSDNYGIITDDFSVSTNPWEFVIEFTTGNDITTSQALTGCSTGHRPAFMPQIYNGNLTLWWLGSNGSDWNGGGSVGLSISANTTYKLRFRNTGGSSNTTTYVDRYIDGSWSTIKTYSSQNTAYSGLPLYLGVGESLIAPFLGTINCAECTLMINNIEVWNGNTPILNPNYTSFYTKSETKPTLPVTQAEYEALVSGGTVDANTLYIIVSGS